MFSFIFFNLQIANLNLYVCNNYFNLDIPYNSHTGNIRYTSARYTNFFISPLPTIRYHTIIVMHKSLSLYNHNKFTVMRSWRYSATNLCRKSVRRIDLSFRSKGSDELNTGRAILVRRTCLAKLCNE